MILPDSIKQIKEYSGIEDLFICGGYLRDFYSKGSYGKDIDIFVDCTPGQLKELMKHLMSFGRIDYGQYGSPRFYPESGNENYVDIVPFYNFIVSDHTITDIKDLLHNFDFSANALAYNIKTGELIDTENGLIDIDNRILRALRTDFPEKSIPANKDLSTNTVYWFRLLHYQNRLNFTFESGTEQWIIENAWRYKYIDLFRNTFFEPSISPQIKEIISNVH